MSSIGFYFGKDRRFNRLGLTIAGYGRRGKRNATENSRSALLSGWAAGCREFVCGLGGRHTTGPMRANADAPYDFRLDDSTAQALVQKKEANTASFAL